MSKQTINKFLMVAYFTVCILNSSFAADPASVIVGNARAQIGKSYQLGQPPNKEYVYGGVFDITNWTGGFDCSGLVSYAGNLRISSNKTVTITSGTYYLSGINVTAKAKLNIEENVNIFLTGKVTVAANAEVNYAGGDYGLVIFCRTDENINISGGGDMRGIIYAPESFAHISGQGLTVGNVFAKRVDVTGQGTIVGTGKVKTGGRSIMSAGRNTAPSNLAVFELKEVYSYPNPAKRVNPKIHFNCGVSDASVNLRIFTVAGEQVFSSDISGSYDSGKNAYEYEWDTAGKASGVYIYLIRADRNGVTLKKTGKMAVIK